MKPTIVEGWAAQHEMCRQVVAESKLRIMWLEHKVDQLEYALQEMQQKYNNLLEELNESVR